MGTLGSTTSGFSPGGVGEQERRATISLQSLTERCAGVEWGTGAHWACRCTSREHPQIQAFRLAGREMTSAEGYGWGTYRVYCTALFLFLSRQNRAKSLRVHPMHVLVRLIRQCPGDESLPNGKIKESLMDSLTSGQNIPNS